MTDIDALVAAWLRVDPNPQSRDEVAALAAAQDYTSLAKMMTPRIAFGTAGLRLAMAPGFAHMNDVTVLQASQGLVRHVVATGGHSIVVGYDHRHHSQRFAELTASVALAGGLHVLYLGATTDLSAESGGSCAGNYVHTPMVPFAIDLYHASAGVMVTASHNPARDNGYKVYWGNGCQIIPPQDGQIARSIDANLDPWPKVWDVADNFAAGRASGALRSVRAEVTDKYVAAVKTQLVRNPTISYPFVYTPMHGVGLAVFEQVCALFDVQVDVVPEQAHPDPDFPTVKFPNPEEAGALDLAIARAKRQGAKLVVASDPDADRFSVAVETKRGWRQLTGNEIGILFAVYVIEELTPRELLPKTYLLNSTVSSQLLLSVARVCGCHFQDTLTGFKWIGNKAIDLKSAGFHVPFGYEEAIGYMFLLVNDKDGISAAAVWMQLYEKWFALSGTDPADKLEQIYAKYGWYKECNGYYKVDSPATTNAIFNDTIRPQYDANPATLGDFAIAEWRDLTTGYDSATADHKPLLPTDASSQMITAVLRPRSGPPGEQVRFTCRGLGTEPKLKVYIEGSSQVGEAAADALAKRCWQVLREQWFRPEANGLEEVV